MRGKLISLSSNKKMRESSRISELELRIKSLEVAYSASKEQHILNELRKAKLELNKIIHKQTQFLIQRLCLENFEHCNKSGRFLANQLKINKEKTTITSYF